MRRGLYPNHFMKKQIGILLCIFLFAGHGFAQTAEVRKKQFNLEKAGLAIQGYDPVAYSASKRRICSGHSLKIRSHDEQEP